MMTGGVDSMEKYKYMLGQAHAYQLIIQEISNLLEPKEQENEQGNVIDIGKGSTKKKLNLAFKINTIKKKKNLTQKD